ncbi:FecR family protein [Bacteroides sp. 519]|uniref:FecR family protein n=1 Tax=Bacteroides sp. 519 TaxID=2302937 RepID=UPI0013D2B66E|nr:FecR domain-containing protein [Bacteroides sp. 519]NDV58651.1 DUF4974 domain-containing protein [Bacteroides sp. 519]
MEKEKLHKLFEGIASSKEKKEVRVWLEASEENRKTLLREREFFDAMILLDHKDTNLDSLKKKQTKLAIILTRVAAIVAIVLLAGSLWYTKKMSEQLEQYQAAINTISVPAGQRANIQLADGTNVWLNARSKITYPSFFTETTRKVELDGEAYFEVKHNPERPFIVQTSRHTIEVSGTSFNVDAYSASPNFETALMDGSVLVTSLKSLQQIKLSPGYKALDNNGTLLSSEIKDYDIYRWKEGLICFKNQNFIDLMKRFEKCYGIRITIENKQLENKVFSGKFRISDGVDKALRIMQREGQYTFERNKDEDVVLIK